MIFCVAGKNWFSRVAGLRGRKINRHSILGKCIPPTVSPVCLQVHHIHLFFLLPDKWKVQNKIYFDKTWSVGLCASERVAPANIQIDSSLKKASMSKVRATAPIRRWAGLRQLWPLTAEVSGCLVSTWSRPQRRTALLTVMRLLSVK